MPNSVARERNLPPPFQLGADTVDPYEYFSSLHRLLYQICSLCRTVWVYAGDSKRIWVPGTCSSDKVQHRTNQPAFTEVIQARHLTWFRHVTRMDYIVLDAKQVQLHYHL